LPTKVPAQGEVTVKVQPETSALKVGDTVTVQILVENVLALSGADVELQFDPAVLQAHDADPGREGLQVQPGDFPPPDFQAANTVDNKSGLAHYAVVLLPPNEPVSGSGVIKSITFEAMAEGVSPLTLARTDLVSGEAQLIEVTPVPGQVTVGE
jgi:hypothetical protein